MSETVAVYLRVTRPVHEWLKVQADANATTIAMMGRLLIESHAGQKLEVRQLLIHGADCE